MSLQPITETTSCNHGTHFCTYFACQTFSRRFYNCVHDDTTEAGFVPSERANRSREAKKMVTGKEIKSPKDGDEKESIIGDEVEELLEEGEARSLSSSAMSQFEPSQSPSQSQPQPQPHEQSLPAGSQTWVTPILDLSTTSGRPSAWKSWRDRWDDYKVVSQLHTKPLDYQCSVLRYIKKLRRTALFKSTRVTFI